MSRHEPESPESQTAAAPAVPPAPPVGSAQQYSWPGLADRTTGRPAEPGDRFDLPPLPTLRPLSIFRPFAPMAPHPAGTVQPDPRVTPAAPAVAPIPSPARSRTESRPDGAVTAEPAETERLRTAPAPVEPVRSATVLVIGGAAAHRTTVTRRLAGAGMRVLLQSAQDLTEDPALVGVEGSGHRSVPGDRADTDGVVRMVSEAIDADEQLTGLVVLPGPHPAPVDLSDPTGQVADALADALSAEVLGPAAAVHTAIQRWAAARRRGRIVVVVADGPTGSGSAPGGGTSWPYALSAAALTVLADHLAIAAAGSGVGIVVVGVGRAGQPGAGSARAELSRLAEGIVLALGPLAGLPGLDPVAGSVLRITL